MATAITFEETKNYDPFATTGLALEGVPKVAWLESVETQKAPSYTFGMSSDSTCIGYGLDRRVPHPLLTDTQPSVAERWGFYLRRGGGDTDETSGFVKLDATESSHTVHGLANLFARIAERTVILEVKTPTSVRLSDATCDRLSLHDATLAFSEGFEGIRPSRNTLENAESLVRAAISKCARADIDVDDSTGSLAFDLRLRDGTLLFAEIDIFGELNADLFDDKGEEAIWVKHFPNPSFSDLMDIL